MHNAPPRTVFDAITDFLASDPTPQAIIAYRLPADLQQRAHDLLERNAAGQLTPAEHEEMQAFMNADELIALLKAKTKLKLQRGTRAT